MIDRIESLNFPSQNNLKSFIAIETCEHKAFYILRVL